MGLKFKNVMNFDTPDANGMIFTRDLIADIIAQSPGAPVTLGFDNKKVIGTVGDAIVSDDGSMSFDIKPLDDGVLNLLRSLIDSDQMYAGCSGRIEESHADGQNLIIDKLKLNYVTIFAVPTSVGMAKPEEKKDE